MSLWLLCEGNKITNYFFSSTLAVWNLIVVLHVHLTVFHCNRPSVTDCSHQILFSLLETLSFGSLTLDICRLCKCKETVFTLCSIHTENCRNICQNMLAKLQSVVFFFLMCSVIKYPYLPLKGLEFPGGGGFCKITTLEEIYEA